MLIKYNLIINIPIFFLLINEKLFYYCQLVTKLHNNNNNPLRIFLDNKNILFI